MGGSHIKIKILYVMKILKEETDENHCLTAKQISERLKMYGIEADRRSIYDDIEVLSEYGMDIIKESGNKGWFLGEREFELAELKLLIDAVKTSKFISLKKTDILVKKLKKFTNEHNVKDLDREIILNVIKTNNKWIYYSIDSVHKAIAENHKITFQYSEWTENKEIRLRKNGQIYEVSPWGVLWSEEQYYLLAYESCNDEIRHYRIDRMCNVSIVENTVREGEKDYKDYIFLFTSKMFAMYGGEDEWVELKCSNYMANVIIDRFGTDLLFTKVGNSHFLVRVLITISPQFWGWITSMGGDIEIVGPEKIRNEYINYINGILCCMK